MGSSCLIRDRPPGFIPTLLAISPFPLAYLGQVTRGDSTQKVSNQGVAGKAFCSTECLTPSRFHPDCAGPMRAKFSVGLPCRCDQMMMGRGCGHLVTGQGVVVRRALVSSLLFVPGPSVQIKSRLVGRCMGGGGSKRLARLRGAWHRQQRLQNLA